MRVGEPGPISPRLTFIEQRSSAAAKRLPPSLQSSDSLTKSCANHPTRRRAECSGSWTTDRHIAVTRQRVGSPKLIRDWCRFTARCTSAIARAANRPPAEVIAFFAQTHGLVIPDNFTTSDVLLAVRHADGKGIMEQGPNSVRAVFGVRREDVARAMTRDE